ncbi:MAG: gamma-glutamyltransferase [Candidatus Sedimenticola sp. (ex Thyasira tokunagai)]
MSSQHGIVAAGHESTAQAAIEIFREGGNAFDAALAALFTSCVAEPVLSSLGGGGFLLAQRDGKAPLVYDFFAHTPKHKPKENETELYPILADFGTAQQEFHIGMGSIATPGVIKGLFAVHRDLCRLPLKVIIEPACEIARNGVVINAFQHYISDIVSPIIKSSTDALRIHQSSKTEGEIAGQGEVVTHPEMADAFESLAIEGEDLFYLGEMGRKLISTCKEQGGCMTAEDLSNYELVRRHPLILNYHGAQLATNPAPSVGGTLIAFTLALLERERLGRFPANSFDHLQRIARAMQLTQELRQERGIDQNLNEATSQQILGSEHLERYHKIMQEHSRFSRGTTQISVADSDGNFASMTLSNGEGSGFVIPNTGIMLNNMLGEEDINPYGFHQWPEDRRIASMMSPSLVTDDNGRTLAVGSGGSNRIRSAILQVLVNLLDLKLPINEAVEQSRLHYESGLLNFETGPEKSVIEQLMTAYPEHRLWPDKNLFFGGAHCVLRDGNGNLYGKGDSRRGGVCQEI